MAVAAHSSLTATTEREFWAPYYRGKVLGKGSFGTVYEVLYKEDRTARAVKVVWKTGKPAKDLETVACLRREAACWLRLDHPNIVKLFGAFELEMAWTFPMEMMRGGDMLDMVTKMDTYGEAVAKRLIGQIMDALAYMHGDLKLENIMLTTKEGLNATLKLSDFDLACDAHDAATLREACGTPGYVAPEILTLAQGKNATVGTACDVWSVGVISYILLCGHPPFTMDDDDQCARDMLAGNWSFPEDIWTGVSDLAKDFVSRMIVVDSTKRITAAEALRHPWLKNDTSTAANTLPGALQRLAKFNARRKWKVAVKAISAAAFLSKLSVASKAAAAAAPGGVAGTRRPSQKFAAMANAMRGAPETPKVERRVSDLVIQAPALAEAVMQQRLQRQKDEEERLRMAMDWNKYLEDVRVSSILLESPLCSLSSSGGLKSSKKWCFSFGRKKKEEQAKAKEAAAPAMSSLLDDLDLGDIASGGNGTPKSPQQQQPRTPGTLWQSSDGVRPSQSSPSNKRRDFLSRSTK